HSMGNWSPGSARHAHRDQAVYALDRLDKLGIKPSVYVNHSGSLSNVGGPWGWYQRADDPNHPFCCLDLLKASGFRFYWIENGTTLEKFGDHLEYASEQLLQRAIRQYPWRGLLHGRREGRLSPLAFPGDADAHRRLLVSFFNRAITRIEGRDGT